jgi:predicted O-methyltransferase YrrM
MTVYNDVLSQYVNDLFALQDETLQSVRQAIPQKGLPAIYIHPEEGRFLQVLVRACGVKRALEIGSLGGYSGIWIARGLAPGGRLITLEKDPHHARVSREHFAQAGLEGRVEVRQGDAHTLLKQLTEEAPFDFVFIDAEKPGYPAYLDWAVDHVRIGGVIAAHNAFQSGTVAYPNPDTGTRIMDDFNRMVAANPRLLSTIFPAGDGTLIAVRVS